MSHGDHREEFELEDDHPHAYDVTEPKYSIIAIFGIVTIVILVVTVLGIQFYFDRFKEQQVYTEVLAPEGVQLKDLRAKEDSLLHTYGYEDRQKGLVRIPIARAMELMEKEAAENKLKYNTADQKIKPPAEQLGAPEAPAQPGPAGATPIAPGSTAAAQPATPGTPANSPATNAHK